MKLFKLSFLAIIMLIVITFALPVAAKDYRHIKIATEGAYAPYNFKDAGGNLVGFEIDLAADLCKRMGIKCSIVEQAWDGIIPSLVAGKYDAIMAGMSIKAKREKVISFSRYYCATPILFTVLKSSPLADFKTKLKALTLDDVSAEEQATLDQMRKAFKGKTVGVQVSTTHEDFMIKMMPDIEIKSYDKMDNMILDLLAGRIDIGLTSLTFLSPLMKKPEGKNLRLIGPVMTKGPFGRGVGVGVRKEDTKLRDMFSKAIDEAIADGTLSRLAIKWFGFDNSAKE
ncbi:MAG: transporter substrate-binding domain-containing protein [Deltaproteobacteria bacterium]|nr:transporter substrate-binding domain-containing protein [Deltaproteobacteria bacterium]MBW1993762.1 transporter substrate-binding domain-containing protein [Deltaproteobacteria bacterium]MBW2154528.1 transporter substrate-binding domain-containing protein [Deltaproteobacteria bacterium]